MDWGAIYASLIAEFGWTWEYIDEEMTLPRLNVITERWSRVPPLTVTVASIAVGLGMPRPGKGETSGQAANDEDMGELVGMMGGVTSEMPEWLKAGMT